MPKGRVPTKDIEEVSSSWQRCASELLINPESQTGPHVATESELRIFREPLTRAIIYSQEEIDGLFAFVRQDWYVVLLCNSEGVVIHHRGDEARDEEDQETGDLARGCLSRKSNSRVQMVGSARASLNSGFGSGPSRATFSDTLPRSQSCATAPIFDRKGKLTLAFNCCTVSRGPADRLALAAAKGAAHAVEERLFREFFGNVWTIALPFRLDRSSPAFVFLAVDSDLRILGADRTARMRGSVSMMIVSIAVCLYQPSLTTIGLPFDATRKRISQHASAVRMLRSGMY